MLCLYEVSMYLLQILLHGDWSLVNQGYIKPLCEPPLEILAWRDFDGELNQGVGVNSYIQE